MQNRGILPKKIIVFLVLVTCSHFGFSQDTIRIDASSLNTKVLKAEAHHYLVYFKNGRDSSKKSFSVWNRKVERVQYNGKPAIAVTQDWDANDGAYHTAYSVNDEKTFFPIYHKVWWKGRGTTSFDFQTMQSFMNDTLLTADDTARTKKAIYTGFQSSKDQFFLNWHLDLEVFSILPYRDKAIFLVNFYDPGYGAPQNVAYTVIGSEKLIDNSKKPIDCWLLENKYGKTRSLFWISKDTKEVLKEMDETNGKFRFKIKLGFSE